MAPPRVISKGLFSGEFNPGDPNGEKVHQNGPTQMGTPWGIRGFLGNGKLSPCSPETSAKLFRLEKGFPPWTGLSSLRKARYQGFFR